MKILSVNNRYFVYGGVDRYFFNLTGLLESEGHQVIPFSVHDERNRKTPYSRYFMDGIDFFGRAGLAHFSEVAGRALFSHKAQKKIERLIKDTGPEVAHIHNIYHSISPSILSVLKRHKIPIVQTLHDFEHVCPVCILYAGGRICQRCRGGRFYHAAFKRCKDDKWLASAMCSIKSYFHNFINAYRHVDAFIMPSRFAREKLEYCGFRPEKTTCVPHFVNLEGVRPADKDRGYILYFGRLHESKGLFTLARAVGKMPGCRLKIAGDGPLRTKLQAFIKEKGFNNISLAGHKQRDELLPLISASSFTVFPSESYEIFGLSIIESFAMRRPVIASRLGPAAEIIDDGINGLLFEPGNVEDLNCKIQYLLNDNALRGQMGKNAGEEAESKYSPGLHYKRIIRIYNRLRGTHNKNHAAEDKEAIAAFA